MDKNSEDDMMKKLNEVHSFLLGGQNRLTLPTYNTNLHKAIQKAVDDLDKTKSSFKSKQIMKIREELLKAIE